MIAAQQTARCIVCPEIFVRRNSMQRVCSPECAVKWARQQETRKKALQDRAAKRQARIEKREWRERNMSRSDRLKQCQKAFNAYIRARDAGKPCISCGGAGTTSARYSVSVWHAGHYRSTAAAPELRFEPDNVHKQCNQCNLMLSGNLVEYRKGLLAKIGAERLAWIEGPHEPKKYTTGQLQAMTADFNKKARQIAQQHELARPA